MSAGGLLVGFGEVFFVEAGLLELGGEGGGACSEPDLPEAFCPGDLECVADGVFVEMGHGGSIAGG